LDSYGEHYFHDEGDFIEYIRFSRVEIRQLIAAFKIEDIEWQNRNIPYPDLAILAGEVNRLANAANLIGSYVDRLSE